MRHKNHFVFIGDARTRQLCKSFISQFTVDGKGLDSTDVLQAANLNFKDAKLKLEVQFLWRPQLNISMINDFQNWMVNLNYKYRNTMLKNDSFITFKKLY